MKQINNSYWTIATTSCASEILSNIAECDPCMEGTIVICLLFVHGIKRYIGFYGIFSDSVSQTRKALLKFVLICFLFGFAGVLAAYCGVHKLLLSYHIENKTVMNEWGFKWKSLRLWKKHKNRFNFYFSLGFCLASVVNAELNSK